MTNFALGTIGLSGAAIPFSVTFTDPSGFVPLTLTDDGTGNVTFQAVSSFTINAPGGYNWQFNGTTGFSGPGYFGADLLGNFTCNSITLNTVGTLVDDLGNLACLALSVAGTQVLTGQVTHQANLAGTATLAQVITAFNNLLAALQAVKLMA